MFTFIVNRIGELYDKPFDDFITDNLLGKADDFERHQSPTGNGIDDGEKIFYKFIISEEVKPDILNELYLGGYSEDYLFPGYGGVVLAIENRIKLDKIHKNTGYFSNGGLTITINNDQI